MKKYKKSRNKIWVRTALLGFLLLIIAGVIFYFRQNNKADQQANKPSDVQPAKTEPTPGQDKEQIAPTPTSPTSTLKGDVISPFGSFVSTHVANISGTPSPSNIESICLTTPSAICDITFTKDGIVKSLGKKTTDGNGVAFWSWKLQDAGLTQGNWDVSATASSTDQSKTTKDPVKFEVGK